QASFTIRVDDVDEFDVTAPVDADPAADALAEDAAVGTPVPLRVQAIDADLTNASVSYSLLDDAGGRFAIDAGTGQVSLAAALDAEAATSHTITVRASSADGSQSQASFTIAVNDVDEFDLTPLVDVDPAADALPEDAAIGALVPLRVQASDGDRTNSSVSYSLIDDAGGRFAIDAGSGQVSVAARLDAETATSHTITVRASSADGSSSQASFSIAVNDVDEFDVTLPVDADTAVNRIPLGAVAGATIGLHVTARDADILNSGVSYRLLDDAGGRFAIDAASGEVTLARSLAGEWLSQHLLQVEARSADGSTAQASFAVEVELEPRAPVFTSSDRFSVPENQRQVGTVTATDEDSRPGPLRFTISGGADAAQFEIDAVSGQLRFRTAPDAEAPLDADRDNRYELRVQASDGALVTEQAIQVVVTGVDEAPQRINNSLSVHNGQVQLSLLTRDPESPAAALVYTVSSDVGGWFALASAPAQRLASFTQAQVDAGEVIFRLDGTGRMPGYRLAVSDGTHSLPPTAPSLSIIGPIPVIGQVSSAPAAPAEAAPAAAPPASSSASTAAAAEAAAEAEATRKKAASGKLAGSAISGTLPGAEPGTPDRVTVDSPVARLTGNTSAFAATGGAPASPLLRPVMLRSEDVMVTSGLADVLRPMAISDNSLSWRFLGAQDVADPAARSSLLQALDRVRDDVAGQDIEGTVVIGTSALVSGGLSVGYVLWLLRGGVLIATMVSAVPAWAGIDPLPVLAQGRGQDEDDAEDEGDPIERLFSRARRLIHRPEAATPSHAAAEVPVAPSAASPLPAGLAEGPVAAAQPAPASAAQKLQELDA
ncbi:MAG: cadherin domain-containing protein, partial [Rubrivivax sp.]|nr:cadherin domain-containing protein [Rubrivivax sp.]